MDLVTRPRRFEVWLVKLDPTQGSEIRKTRPCVIVSPDEMNRHLRTAIIAPLTSTRKAYPSRINLTFQRKKGQIVLDQLRTVDMARLAHRLGRIGNNRALEVCNRLQEMFAPY